MSYYKKTAKKFDGGRKNTKKLSFMVVKIQQLIAQLLSFQIKSLLKGTSLY